MSCHLWICIQYNDIHLQLDVDKCAIHFHKNYYYNAKLAHSLPNRYYYDDIVYFIIVWLCDTVWVGFMISLARPRVYTLSPCQQTQVVYFKYLISMPTEPSGVPGKAGSLGTHSGEPIKASLGTHNTHCKPIFVSF